MNWLWNGIIRFFSKKQEIKFKPVVLKEKTTSIEDDCNVKIFHSHYSKDWS